MKTHRPLASLLALVLAATSLAGAEDADHKHKKKDGAEASAATKKAPEWSALFGGASLAVVWQSATAASDKIDAALAAKKLEGVADWAETIHLAAHALEDQVKIADREQARRLKGAFEQAAKIADDVLDGASHGEIDKAADAQRRLKSALAVAKSRMPKAILDAAPQPVRFAKASPHSHD